MLNEPSVSAKITHGYATVNGIKLHYAEAGAGDLVMLLHGFPEFWYSWRHQLAALAPHFHVVAPDLRGYNLSDKPSNIEDYRVEVIVEDVIGLMDHFNARQAAIVGHDWGGAISWSVAQKYPERVSKLAVMQVPPPAVWSANMSLSQLLRSWYMFLFQVPRLPEWIISRKDFAKLTEVFKASETRIDAFSAADIAAYREALRKPGALTSALNYYRANVRRLMRRSAKSSSEANRQRYTVPTLFIFAEQDVAILPRTAAGVERVINAPYRELRIPDSGHWVQNEAAAEVNAALLEFLVS